jgi:hypothetical protein
LPVTVPTTNAGTSPFLASAGGQEDALFQAASALAASKPGPSAPSPSSPFTQQTVYLYVSSALSDQILRYNAATGKFDKVWDQNDAMKLDTPQGMAWGPDNNLYVASHGTNQILQYNGTNGNLIGVYETGSDPQGPADIAFGSDGNLYVVSATNKEVDRYQGPMGANPGKPMPSANNQGATFASDSKFMVPWGITFGSDGKIYVSDANSASGVGIDRFNADGTFDVVFISPGGQLTAPRGMAFGADGNFYVATTSPNTQGGAVMQYDKTGKFLSNFANAGGLTTPFGIVFGGSSGNLFVASTGIGSSSVIQYSKTDGSVVQPNPFASGGGLGSPWDLNFHT